MSESDRPTAVVLQSPPGREHKRDVNSLIRRIGQDATILVRNPHKTRRLTVEYRSQDTYDTPDWNRRHLSEDEHGLVCSGYGTTYVIVGYEGDRADWVPELRWPSCTASCVWDVVVEEPGEQLVAEQTAADLLREVSYDGR